MIKPKSAVGYFLRKAGTHRKTGNDLVDQGKQELWMKENHLHFGEKPFTTTQQVINSLKVIVGRAAFSVIKKTS